MKCVFAKLSTVQWVIPFLIGTTIFLYVTGLHALDFQNISWLAHCNDSANHYIGWQFFRNSPWTFPLGLNPNYGLELSSSIVFSDSNPLLAIVFKSINPILPDVFQYFGLWLLLCFILQALLAWKLLGLYIHDVTLKTLGAVFFTASLPMLFRLELAHLNLVMHAFVLAAVYLALKPDHRGKTWRWLVLLSLAVTIHAYLLGMVLALWMADLLQRFTEHRRAWPSLVCEILGGFACMGVLAWQSGYFVTTGTISSTGFGYFRMNLFSLINPMGWSSVVPNIPMKDGDYEGFNYLGLGLLLLTPIAGYQLWQKGRAVLPHRPFLWLCLLGLFLFAVSSQVGIAHKTISIPVPDTLLSVAGIFRSSGRMFWPVFYVLMLGILCATALGFSRRTAILVLSAVLLIQGADTYKPIKKLRDRFSAAPAVTWNMAFSGPFWEEVHARYSRIRKFPLFEHDPLWKEASYFAVTHGMTTDIVDLARINRLGLLQSQVRRKEELQTGRPDPQTLYLLESPLLTEHMDRRKHLIAKVGNTYVLAPFLKDFSNKFTELEISPYAGLPLLQKESPFHIGVGQEFSEMFLSGWSGLEEGGIWSDSATAEMAILVPDTATSLTLWGHSLIAARLPQQRLIFTINGHQAASFTVDTAEIQPFTIPLPPESLSVNEDLPPHTALVRLTVESPDRSSPSELGFFGGDMRKLGFRLNRLNVQ